MKFLFMLLFSLAIVVGATAFTGEYEKSPPAVPTVVVVADDAIVGVALATAEFRQDITTEAGSHLTFEAVIPYTEFNFIAPENGRVRWQHYSLDDKLAKSKQPFNVKPTLRNRSCLELNC